MEPPAAPAYLETSSESKRQRGGTLIAVLVSGMKEHFQRLSSPDGYRPEVCGRCGEGRLHANDHRYRWLRDLQQEVRIRRYLCAVCRAVWQVLPAFVPRFLQRSWPGLEQMQGERAGPLPVATKKRLAARLSLSGIMVLELLQTLGVLPQEDRSGAPTRAGVVQRLVQAGVVDERTALQESAVLVHRAVPGVRLM